MDLSFQHAQAQRFLRQRNILAATSLTLGGLALLLVSPALAVVVGLALLPIAATLWEALYDMRPFDGRSLRAFARSVRRDQPKPQESSAVPMWLRKVLERGLAGRTERDVALDLELTMRRLGAQAVSFPPIVAGGAHGALPHAEPRDVAIEPGRSGGPHRAAGERRRGGRRRIARRAAGRQPSAADGTGARHRAGAAARSRPLGARRAGRAPGRALGRRRDRGRPGRLDDPPAGVRSDGLTRAPPLR